MNSRIELLLAEIDPFWDRIVRRPLSQMAIARLERSLGVPFPACLHTFLAQVGLFQDLTHTQNNAILVFETVSEYTAARQDLLDGLYGEVDMKLIPFGHNGSGDVFALLGRADGDADIYFMRQETPSAEPTETTFTDWLESIVVETVAHMQRRLPNRDKAWCVQFAFRGASFDDILAAMRLAGEVGFDQHWNALDTTPSGVRKLATHVTLDDMALTVRRLEYPHWVSPWYFIDMQEPLETGQRGSTIQKLDELFHDRVPGYGMINFGAVVRSAG